MWGFYWRSIRRIPGLAAEAVKRVDTLHGWLTIIVWMTIGGTVAGAWWQELPWRYPVAAFSAFLVYGFLKAVYQEYSEVEEERDELKERVVTDEKRAAIGAGLQRLYSDGEQLMAEIMDSTDESSPDVWEERQLGWRQNVIDYLKENVSVGKAQYVDGVTSVNGATIMGMKSDGTLEDKTIIVLHIEEQLKRLREVMKDY
jgi:hypothetical protein